MSQFITIIPAEWTRVPDEVLNAMNSTYVLQWVRECNFTVLNEGMCEHWPEAPGSIGDAVMLNNEILVIK